MAGKKKYYIVVCPQNNYIHGAFEHTPEGLETAEKYKKIISKRLLKTFEIIEKHGA